MIPTHKSKRLKTAILWLVNPEGSGGCDNSSLMSLSQATSFLLDGQEWFHSGYQDGTYGFALNSK